MNYCFTELLPRNIRIYLTNYWIEKPSGKAEELSVYLFRFFFAVHAARLYFRSCKVKSNQI